MKANNDGCNAEENTKERTNKKLSLKSIILLQLIVILYTFSSVAGKLASSKEIFSVGFFIFFGIELFILGIYALLWQQIIKRVHLSVAYANRAMAILWSMLWAFAFFHENITPKNLIGVAIVIIGTVIVNSDDR